MQNSSAGLKKLLLRTGYINKTIRDHTAWQDIVIISESKQLERRRIATVAKFCVALFSYDFYVFSLLRFKVYRIFIVESKLPL